jgi:ubiquitin-protein ligase
MPGSMNPESFSLARRFTTDSTKSPTSENMAKNVDKIMAFPKPNLSGSHRRQKNKEIIPMQLENKTPPHNPSTVFLGLKFMANLRLPKRFPMNMPPMSQHFVTKIIQNKVQI